MNHNSQAFHKRGSNVDTFLVFTTGSPFHDVSEHVRLIGKLRRIDFETYGVAGEVVYRVEGDSVPTSQQDEEARIATLAHALKALGNREDAAEFIRCLNGICEWGDARYRQVVASYYYGEIAERGASPVLKEMALIAMHLASLNPVAEEWENETEMFCAPPGEPKPQAGANRGTANERASAGDDHEANGTNLNAFARRSLFNVEVAAISRMIRGRRRISRPADDEWSRVRSLEAEGAEPDESDQDFFEELDERFRRAEAMDQYDEGGAIIQMSTHERTVACGRVDHEFTAGDLPEQARFLAGDLLRAYASGVEIEEIWDEINGQLDVLFPVKGRTAEGGGFFSRANIELQRFTREALEEMLEDCYGNYHLTAMRKNRSYRLFYGGIRRATDTRTVGEVMKQAYEARQSGEISLKHLTALKTAANNQRERLLSAPLSATAYKLVEEILTASEKKLGYLTWAMYGDNDPSHPIHRLNSQERTRVWEVMTARKGAILLPRLSEFHARLCATWGRVAPLAWFIFLVALADFFELPRLRKAISVVQNKRRPFARKTSSAPKPAVPLRGAPAVKRGAAVGSRAAAASCI
jgi:hypothetical protein